jgi:hypothetical protein
MARLPGRSKTSRITFRMFEDAAEDEDIGVRGQQNPISIKKALGRLKARGSEREFSYLVERGADRVTLLVAVELLARYKPHPTSFEDRFGFKRQQAKTRANQVRSVADVLERILSPAPYASLIWSGKNILNLEDAEQFGTEIGRLLGTLRAEADRIEKLPKLVRPRTDVMRAIIICALVRHVQETTKSLHYAEVSSIVGSGLGKDGYDATALKSFCSDHKDLLAIAGRISLRLLGLSLTLR